MYSTWPAKIRLMKPKANVISVLSKKLRQNMRTGNMSLLLANISKVMKLTRKV